MTDAYDPDDIEEFGDRANIHGDAKDGPFPRVPVRSSAAEVKTRVPVGRFPVDRSDNAVEHWQRKLPDVPSKLPKLSRYRQHHWLSTNRILFILLVVIPTLVATVYFSFVASDRYVSTAELTVAEFNVNNGQGGQSNISTQNNNSAGLSAQDIVILNAVSDYMTSHNIVNDLQKRLDLRALWSTPLADWFYRLGRNANNEDIYEYYQYRVSSSFDSSTGLITLTVEAFRPQDAQKIAQEIMRLTARRVEELDKAARMSVLEFAESEVSRYRQQLVLAQLATQRFRNQHAEINSAASATAISTVVSQIEQQLADSRTELASQRHSLSASAPTVVNTRTRILSLQEQLEAEKARLGSTHGGKSSTYADVLTEYSRLTLEEGFASTAYTSALTELVVARFQANQPHFSMLPFIEPQFPEVCQSFNWQCSSIEPNRPLTIATLFAAGLVAFGMLVLIISSVRAHRSI